MRKIIMILSLGIFWITHIGIPVAQSQEYTVAIPEIPYYPYYQQEEGNITGFIPELVRKFARDIGIEVTLRALPVRRYYLLFFEGEIDFVAPDTPYWSPDLKEGYDVIYSQPFMQSIDGLLVRNELKDKGIDAIEKVGTFIPFKNARCALRWRCRAAHIIAAHLF